LSIENTNNTNNNLFKKNILSISHLDMDGYGCQIVLRKFYGEFQKMNTTYGNIKKYIGILDEILTRTFYDIVYITDLSFSKEELKELYIVANKYKDTMFYYIDHHIVDIDYKRLITNNFKLIITNKASATKLVYKYLSKKYNIKDKELETFIDYINAYDIWLKDKEPNNFKIGFFLNEIFWNKGKNYFWSSYKDNFKIKNSDKDYYKSIIEQKNKLFQKLEKSKRIMKFDDRIFLIYLDKHQSFITIDYPNYLVYIIIKSNGRGSIRFNEKLENYNFMNTLKNKLLDLEYIGEAGGHELAMGCHIKKPTPKLLVDLGKFLVKEIDILLENKGL